MNKRLSSSNAMLLLGIVSSWLTLAVPFGMMVEASCPTTNKNGWYSDSTVHYSAAFTGTELNKIAAALTNWTSHNTISGNCSNVGFSPVVFGEFTITSDSGQAQGRPNAVALTSTDTPIAGFVVSATTVFYWNAVYVDNNNVSHPSWARNATTVYYDFIKKVMLHETGHTMGFADFTVNQQQLGQETVMNGYIGTNDSSNNMPLSVQSCDDRSVNSIPQYTCTLSNGNGDPSCYYVNASNGMASNYYLYPIGGCETDYVDNGAGCCTAAACPIIIDILGNGFSLTGLNSPVSFDIGGEGHPWFITWTAPNSDDAFLVLDRNGNGRVDNGTELFGNYTAQPETLPDNRNGFIALAEYDKATNGGNGDGLLNSSDAVFSSLRLWQDSNHNAMSEPSELHTLTSMNVSAISIDYKDSKRMDEFGNRFRYRAKVYDSRGASVGRWAWDVFFVKQ